MSGFWRQGLDHQSCPYTAFSIPCTNEKFQFTRIPQGLKSSPGGFQAAMTRVIKDLPLAFVYLDDIMIASSKSNHIKALRELFERFRSFNIKLSPKKCQFARGNVKYLGFVISSNGIEIDPAKIAIVDKFPVPKNVKELRRYIGFCTYLRRNILKFSKIISPLHNLLKEDQKYEWNTEHQNAFNTLKQKIKEATLMYFPNPKKEFIITVDASKTAIGYIILKQKNEQGSLRIVQCGGRKLRP